MRVPATMTRTMKVSEVKNQLSRLINAISSGEMRVLVEKNGIPVAAVVSAEDLQRLIQWEREREERFAVIDRMREAFKDVPPEEIEREADRSVAAARQRLRERIREAAARSA
jgi:prevent-host-death family protein